MLHISYRHDSYGIAGRFHAKSWATSSASITVMERWCHRRMNFCPYRALKEMLQWHSLNKMLVKEYNLLKMCSSFKETDLLVQHKRFAASAHERQP